jgi:hypothetical protein
LQNLGNAPLQSLAFVQACALCGLGCALGDVLFPAIAIIATETSKEIDLSSSASQEFSCPPGSVAGHTLI